MSIVATAILITMVLLGIGTLIIHTLRYDGCKGCYGCELDAVVVCKTYNDKTIYLCLNCLRSLRFRETEFFKSILPYDC